MAMDYLFFSRTISVLIWVDILDNYTDESSINHQFFILLVMARLTSFEISEFLRVHHAMHNKVFWKRDGPTA